MRQLNRFRLCEHFHCGPHELEQWPNQDTEDFMQILRLLGDKAERDRKAAERTARR